MSNHSRFPSGSVMVPTSPGELLDKISILRIKSERIEDPQKKAYVCHELRLLSDCWEELQSETAEVRNLTTQLLAVNEALWDTEDALRLCEAEALFDAKFIELARSVYKTNDHRARIKKQLNDLLGASIVEQKSYAGY